MISFEQFCAERGFKVEDLISLKREIQTEYDLHKVKIDFENQSIKHPSAIDYLNIVMNRRFKLNRKLHSVGINDEIAYKLINLYSQRIILIHLLAKKSQIKDVIVDKDKSITFFDAHSNSYKCLKHSDWIHFVPLKNGIWQINIGKPEKLLIQVINDFADLLSKQSNKVD